MFKNTNQNFKILSFLLGFTAIISQIILLRELLTVFYGNETSYAIILGSWLFWISVGSFIASFFVNKIKNIYRVLSILQIAIYFILPSTIVLSRISKMMLHIKTGEMIDIFSMFILSISLLAPLTIILGAVYTFLCKLSLSDNSMEGKSINDISNVYIWESLGSAIGGFLFSLIFISLLPDMYVVFIVITLNIAVILFFNKGKEKILRSLEISLILLTLVLFLSGRIFSLDKISRQGQWKGFNVVEITDSIYGNIVLTTSEGEYSLFENGLHKFTTNDEFTSEENIHFPMLEHKSPKSVLLVGGDIKGNIKEILKYKNTTIDYIELDPKVLEIVKKYILANYDNYLKNRRVNIICKDARLFVKNTKKKYDVVIINQGDPVTSLVNRYYTLDFFKEVNNILNSEGILSLSVSSSENYISDATASFLRSINSTLKKVFPSVIVVPGNSNIFIACKTSNILTLNPTMLDSRRKKRGVETKYVNSHYLPFRLNSYRVDYLNKILDKKGDINTDTKPISYLYDIILWSSHFNANFRNFIINIKWLNLRYMLILPIVLLLICFPLQKKYKTLPFSLSIVTTGFSEIIFQIIVILAFQSLYGYAYYKIGFIISSFMAGLIIGSILAKRIISKKENLVLDIYKKIQFSICLYPLLLPLLFIVFRDFDIIQKYHPIFATVFAGLPIISGFIGGIQYPLATYILSMSNVKNDISLSAGFLYAGDVFGASLGAIITGTILIPLLGINDVAIFCSALNFAVFILLSRNKITLTRKIFTA